jgi:hypothetical protein
MLVTVLLSRGEWMAIGVVMLLCGTYAVGYANGRFPNDDWVLGNLLPTWVQAVIIGGVMGALLVLAMFLLGRNP